MEHLDELPVIQTPYKIEYSKLLDTVQLSVARLLDIEGALEMETFSELLTVHNETEHPRIMAEISPRFDEALIHFVTAALIGSREHDVTIRVEASEGFNGHLFWETRLHEHVRSLHTSGLLQTTVRVERYTTSETTTPVNLNERRQAIIDEPSLHKHAA